MFFKKNSGLTLIEVLVAVGLFALIGYFIYSAYANVLEAVADNQLRFEAINLLTNQIEIVRNMAYSDVGIVGGYPIGKIQSQTAISDGVNNFTIGATVRNFDDPFDGTAGGVPNDTAPADYKIVEFSISCSNCPHFSPLTLTTTVAPKSLESASNNGSLFINVFDASGKPVSGANVSVTNNILNPTISINDVTNNSGVLQLIDIPTSTSAYHVTVSKNGYSSDQSYPPGGVNNPNPTLPDATVAKQTVTSISFAIDKVSSINLKTADKMCQAVPGISFQQDGTKLIGLTPDILKYSTTTQTDQNGQKTINNLEWDTYNFTNLSSGYDVMGYNPLLPLAINPNTSTTLNFVMAAPTPKDLLVTVLDENNQPANDVSVNLLGNGVDSTIYTGRNYFFQTDWSASNYLGQSGGVDTENTPGQISLMPTLGPYSTTTQEWLISKTFDLGTPNTTFYELNWNPVSQPASTGSTSVEFQIATNNDNGTWNFLGPDGTPSTFYTATGTIINAINNGNRYLRYKVYLSTQDQNFTPVIKDVSINFSSDCLSAGQSYFEGLSSGTYTITAQKSGYQTYTDNALSISSNWKEYKIKLVKQ